MPRKLNKLIFMPNADKLGDESWTRGRSLLDVPCPMRGLCIGPPGSGKTNVLFNFLIHAATPYKQVLVIHGDPATKEYDALGKAGVKIVSEFPPISYFRGKEKTMVVIDDVPLKGLSKSQAVNADRLLNYVSSHKGVSVVINSQTLTQVPTNLRRACNFYVVWKSGDSKDMTNIASKIGMRPENLNNLFETVLSTPRDSLWVDLTPGTPAPLRRNGFEPLEKTAKYKKQILASADFKLV